MSLYMIDERAVQACLNWSKPNIHRHCGWWSREGLA